MVLMLFYAHAHPNKNTCQGESLLSLPFFFCMCWHPDSEPVLGLDLLALSLFSSLASDPIFTKSLSWPVLALYYLQERALSCLPILVY